MIRKLYRELTIPILLGVRLIKYGGIWGYKKQLQSKIKPNNAEIEVYDAFFSRKGSWIGYSAELEDITIMYWPDNPPIVANMQPRNQTIVDCLGEKYRRIYS